MQKHIAKKRHVSRAAAKLVNAPLERQSRARFAQLTYALSSYTAERRKDGWYVAKTVTSFAGEKPRWAGPFETIETACLSIARHLSVELADRHTRSIEAHKIDRKDPLYGLKPTTRLRTR